MPLQNLRFAWQRLADEIANETADDDVFTQFRNLAIEQVPDGHIGIFNETLFEQANRTVEFLEFSFHNFVGNILRFALDLAL